MKFRNLIGLYRFLSKIQSYLWKVLNLFLYFINLFLKKIDAAILKGEGEKIDNYDELFSIDARNP